MQEFTVAVMCTCSVCAKSYRIRCDMWHSSLVFRIVARSIWSSQHFSCRFSMFLCLWNWKICSFLSLPQCRAKLKWAKGRERRRQEKNEKVFPLFFFLAVFQRIFCDSYRIEQMIHIVNATVYINFYGLNGKERAQSKQILLRQTDTHIHAQSHMITYIKVGYIFKEKEIEMR